MGGNNRENQSLELNELHRHKSNVIATWVTLGSMWYEKGEFVKATANYSEAIHLDPTSSAAYFSRGCAWMALGDDDKAIADLSESIRLDSDCASAFHCRGTAWKRKGELKKAIADHQQAIELGPDDSGLNNDFAWILATCNDDGLRDGKKAVELARKASQLTKWKDWTILDTLAAAYAEAGEFEQAIKYGKLVLDLCPDIEVAEARETLALYQAGKPFREKPKESKP